MDILWSSLAYGTVIGDDDPSSDPAFDDGSIVVAGVPFQHFLRSSSIQAIARGPG
jgi:hypothetical protein